MKTGIFSLEGLDRFLLICPSGYFVAPAASRLLLRAERRTAEREHDTLHRVRDTRLSQVALTSGHTQKLSNKPVPSLDDSDGYPASQRALRSSSARFSRSNFACIFSDESTSSNTFGSCAGPS
jgi:hypothetical protein